MVEPLRHRQTKEAATDMFDLQQPRHISTLHLSHIASMGGMSAAGESRIRPNIAAVSYFPAQN
jgi:hypothetical protein